MMDRPEDFPLGGMAGMERIAGWVGWYMSKRSRAVALGRVLVSDLKAVALEKIADCWRQCAPGQPVKRYVIGAAINSCWDFVKSECSAGVKWLPVGTQVLRDGGGESCNALIDAGYVGPRCAVRPERVASIGFFIEDVRQKLGEESAGIVIAVLEGEPRELIRARVHHQRFYRLVAGISELFQQEFCPVLTAPAVAERLSGVAVEYRRREKIVRQNEANARYVRVPEVAERERLRGRRRQARRKARAGLGQLRVNPLVEAAV